MKEGYIKLHRKFFQHSFWKNKSRKAFDHADAWIDLLNEAAWKDHKILIGNRNVMVRRGEVPHSIRTLAERWKWSRHKVCNFISLLEKETMLMTRNDQKTRLLVIVNYDLYQGSDEKEGTKKGQAKGQKRDSTGTARGQHGDKQKQGKQGNNKTIETESTVSSKEGDGFLFWKIEKIREPLLEAGLESSEAFDRAVKFAYAKFDTTSVNPPVEFAAKVFDMLECRRLGKVSNPVGAAISAIQKNQAPAATTVKMIREYLREYLDCQIPAIKKNEVMEG